MEGFLFFTEDLDNKEIELIRLENEGTDGFFEYNPVRGYVLAKNTPEEIKSKGMKAIRKSKGNESRGKEDTLIKVKKRRRK